MEKLSIERLSGLGSQWETTRISLKLYSCVGSNHTTLDAIRTMQLRVPFGPEDVERIVVRGSQVTVDHVGWKYRPQGLTSAQLNLPFCVATLMAFAEKVEVMHDPAISAKGSKFRHMVRVEAYLKNGVHMEETVESPRGSEPDFASEADVTRKFQNLAIHVLTRSQADEVADLILNADKLDRAARISNSLARA